MWMGGDMDTGGRHVSCVDVCDDYVEDDLSSCCEKVWCVRRERWWHEFFLVSNFKNKNGGVDGQTKSDWDYLSFRSPCVCLFDWSKVVGTASVVQTSA
jgi:hypothetical protein